MTDHLPLSAPADEPFCPKCQRAGGLCHSEKCREEVLPQIKEPSWPKMIGVGYACDRPECNGHVVCAAVFMEPAPRSGCGCHNCTQFRAAMKLERVQAKADAAEQVQISRIERRNDRKRAKDTTRPKREPAKRLLHHMMGGYDRKRPGAVA